MTTRYERGGTAMRGRLVIGALVALALVSAVGVGRATAGLNIDFNLITRPQLVVVPGTPVAYAPGVPANYFFYNGQYYLFADGGWFVAGGYNGPWLTLPPAYVPGALLAVPVHYYRAAPRQWQHWHRAHPPRWAPVWGHGGRTTTAGRTAPSITATAETAMITAATATATMATTVTISEETATDTSEGAIEAPSVPSVSRQSYFSGCAWRSRSSCSGRNGRADKDPAHHDVRVPSRTPPGGRPAADGARAGATSDQDLPPPGRAYKRRQARAGRDRGTRPRPSATKPGEREPDRAETIESAGRRCSRRQSRGHFTNAHEWLRLSVSRREPCPGPARRTGCQAPTVAT